MILAIDPATHCGWAVFEDCKPVACGSWKLGKPGWTPGARIEALALALDSLRLRHGPPEQVFYEKCFGVHPGSGELQHGLIGYLLYWCSRLCVPCEGLAPSSVKKAFTGDGRADKKAMIEEARRRWPDLDIENDNVADALAIGVSGIQLEKKGPSNETEKAIRV